MTQKPKPARRIVSKGKYAANLGKKAGLSSFGIGVILVGVFSLSLTFLTVWFGVPLALCLTFGIASTALLHAGTRVIKDAKQINTGVPLTRANTADLAANDSLVRASQEPMQAQEGVLLRAATAHTQEQHEEQLLKPTTGE